MAILIKMGGFGEKSAGFIRFGDVVFRVKMEVVVQLNSGWILVILGSWRFCEKLG